MIDFSSVPLRSPLGRLLRRPLSLIPRDVALPIVQGPLAGRRWIVGSSTHGCWLGSYEVATQRAFVRLLSSGDTVFDVGAGAGFFTLLAHRLVGGHGTVVAFEPLPRNVGFLRRHLALNAAEGVTIFEGAVGRRTGSGSFLEGENPSQGRLDASGRLTVQVIALNDFVRRPDAALPDLIKIDVEGGELAVLEGAMEVLESKRPHLLIATHGQRLRDSCLRLLARVGYETRTVDGQASSVGVDVLAHPIPPSLSEGALRRAR